MLRKLTFERCKSVCSSGSSAGSSVFSLCIRPVVCGGEDEAISSSRFSLIPQPYRDFIFWIRAILSRGPRRVHFAHFYFPSSRLRFANAGCLSFRQGTVSRPGGALKRRFRVFQTGFQKCESAHILHI